MCVVSLQVVMVTVSGDGDGEGDGVDGNVGDRNEEWGTATMLSTVEEHKGALPHSTVIHPLFDLCFVLLASALATPYVSLCLSVSHSYHPERAVPGAGDGKGKGQQF